VARKLLLPMLDVEQEVKAMEMKTIDMLELNSPHPYNQEMNQLQCFHLQNGCDHPLVLHWQQ